jgi:uncharacterized protein YjbJ (UPF0337 family)
MDLKELPRTALHVQWRLIRLPLTIVETVSGSGQRTASRPQAEARQGLVENVVGRTKELVGIVMGDDRLANEGQVQQAKGEELREAATAEAIADQQRRRAEQEFVEEERKLAQRRAEVEREEAAKEARIEQEKAARKAQVDRETEARKAAADRAAEVEHAQVDRKEAEVIQKRAAKVTKATQKQKAADAARTTAEVLEDARTR